MSEERKTATESQVLIVKILQIIEKQKGMKKWKYKVVDNRKNEFIMQTSIEPRELPVTLKVGKKYFFPIIMNKSGKVGNVDGQYMELIENFELPLSNIPEDEQAGHFDSTITDNYEEARTAVFTIPKPTTNDKPTTLRQALPLSSGKKVGSQLVVSGLPTEAQVLAYYEQYKFVKKAIIDKSDLQVIGKKSFLKKSGFRKFIQAFKLSLEILSKEMTTGDLGIEYEVVARCTAPNGQFVDAVAICQQFEKAGKRTKHDTLTTAMTRAKSRAISDLVAFGEVSAEEIQ
ncbi:hypothetical protein KAR91_31040 [Candidatus Pacearchaeota archaeon]|nr:hypothetical protein [Candidatus Pacearchaeota archaeon]